MNSTILSNTLSVLSILIAGIAPIVIGARVIQHFGWGLIGRCLGIAFIMQLVAGALTSCVGAGGLGILLGGTFAAQNNQDAQLAMAYGLPLIVIAIVLVPFSHWAVLYLSRTSDSRSPFATAIRTTLITLMCWVIGVVLMGGIFAMGLG